MAGTIGKSMKLLTPFILAPAWHGEAHRTARSVKTVNIAAKYGHRTLLTACLLGGLISGLAAPTAPPPAASLDTDPHLAGWWKFDETAGQTAKDTSRHGRDGVLQGSLTFDTQSAPGRLGGALKLDGKDECLQVRGYKGVTGMQARTVAAWIKTPGRAGEIVAWGTDDFGKMWTFGFIRSRVGVTPKGGYLYMSAETSDDAWHHVAVVMRQANPPNLHDHVTLYLDGTEAVIHDIGLLDLWPLETGSEMDVRIGRRFKGLIDDLRLYERALSEEDIKALFTLDAKRP